MSRNRSNWHIKAENPHKNHEASKENISKSKIESFENPGKNILYPNKRQALGVINVNCKDSYPKNVNLFANQNAIKNVDNCLDKGYFSYTSCNLNQNVPNSSSIYTTQYHTEHFSPHKLLPKNDVNSQETVSQITTFTNSISLLSQNISCNTQSNINHTSLASSRVLPSCTTLKKDCDTNVYDGPNLHKIALNDSINVSMHSVEDDAEQTPISKSINAPSPMVVVLETEQPRNEQPNDIFSVPEYAEEILTYLKQSELTYRPRLGYMSKQPDITYSMRATVIDWLVEVGCEYKLINKTLHLACSYVDRFLSVMAISRSKLQLLGTTCMLIAAKFEEIYPPDINEFVYITDGTYTKEQVIRMEQLILKILSFRVGPPTILCFLEKYARMADLPKINFDLAQYLAELTLLDGETYLKHRPSIISCAAICLSNLITHRKAWDTTLQKHSGYAYEEFIPCLKDLYNSLNNAPLNQQQKAVYEKYSHTKYNEVAKLSTPPQSQEESLYQPPPTSTMS